MREVHRVVVLGAPGAGKTTIARRIGAALHVPVTHLDSLYWSDEWSPRDPGSFAKGHAAAIAAEWWVLDGNDTSQPGFAARLERAHAIVIAEASTPVRLGRIVRRRIVALHRDALGPTTNGPLTVAFLRYAWAWGRRNASFPDVIRTRSPGTPVYVVRDASDLDAVLGVVMPAR